MNNFSPQKHEFQAMLLFNEVDLYSKSVTYTLKKLINSTHTSFPGKPINHKGSPRYPTVHLWINIW